MNTRTNHSALKSVLLALALALALPTPVIHATEAEENIEQNVVLPAFNVSIYQPANPAPAGTFATPISHLRFEPAVDLQSRGFPEAQGDITIRGSIFEHSGVQVGALPLFDPQTGHYLGEVPFDPWMMTAPTVITGATNALRGFNGNAGTIQWAWQPIVRSGRIEAAFGTDGLNYQRFVAGDAHALGSGPWKLGFQAGVSRSEADGSRPFMDHTFARYSGRVQLTGPSSQTDVFAAYQSKFYGMPGGYTGAPSFLETDHYRVSIFGANHFQVYGLNESYWEAGVAYRKLVDDYELDRTRIGFFRPYEHQTETGTFALQGTHFSGESWSVSYRAVVLADSIESTELTHAGFQSRTYAKLAVLPKYSFSVGESGTASVSAGVAWDDTNRDESRFSPIAAIELKQIAETGENRFYAEFSGSSQVPGYTAKGSSPAAGAFAGNPALGRERTFNSEIGARITRGRFAVQSALFYRQDRDLADWTFHSSAPGRRQANSVDLDNWGWETNIGVHLGSHRIYVGYAALTKTADYGTVAVDGSFYAMNYAKHRFTAGWVYEVIAGLELRVDAELRRQSENPRRTSDRDAFNASVGVGWQPHFLDGFDISLTIDNVTNSDFQDFPGTVPPGRQITLAAGYTW